MNKPQFNFGDIVKVEGYYPQVFIVDGYREEHYYYPNEDWTDLVYELHCANSLEWLEADEDDLTFVAAAEEADKWLAENPPHEPLRVESSDVLSFMFRGEEKAMSKPKEPRKPTAREISAREAEERKTARKAQAAEIDNLLEIYEWNRKMLAKSNDESYGDRMMAVEAEIKKLVETE